MTVADLIERLEMYPADTPVRIEVNGGATRTGDYLPYISLGIKTLRDTTYGGADEDDGSHNPEFNAAETYQAVCIS